MALIYGSVYCDLCRRSNSSEYIVGVFGADDHNVDDVGDARYARLDGRNDMVSSLEELNLFGWGFI